MSETRRRRGAARAKKGAFEVKSRFARTVLAGAAVGLIAFAVTAGRSGRRQRRHVAARLVEPPDAGQASVLSANADQRVIVLLRNQHTGLTGRSAARQRAQAFAADRAPIVAQLRQLNAPRLVTYKTVSAVATTVSAAEAANLRSDPAVLAVDPDAVVKGPSHQREPAAGHDARSQPHARRPAPRRRRSAARLSAGRRARRCSSRRRCT